MRFECVSSADLFKRHPAVACGVSLLLVILMAAVVLLMQGKDLPVALAQRQPPARNVAAGETMSVERLWYGVVDLRNKCAIEGLSGWNTYLTPKAREKLDVLNRQIWGEDADLGWSYFFGRAMFDIGRPASDAPLVGFYHPWSDVWLITEWQVKPEPKIADVELLCGEWVRRRGEPPFHLRPDWLRREGFRVEQLARSAVENLRQLESLAHGTLPWREALRLDRKQSLDQINVPAVSMQLFGAWLRADQLTLGSEAFDGDHPAPPVLERLVESSERFLNAGREGNVAFFADLAARTNPNTAETLRKLSPDAFNQLVPVYWLADEQWAEAFWVPDHNPDFCLGLTYKQVDSQLQLTRIDLVHFPIMAQVLEKEGSR